MNTTSYPLLDVDLDVIRDNAHTCGEPVYRRSSDNGVTAKHSCKYDGHEKTEGFRKRNTKTDIFQSVRFCVMVH